MAHNTGTDRSGDKAVRQEATFSSATFDPAALDALQKAFDAAWTEVLADPVIRNDEGSVRDLIAKRIVDAASGENERDPEQLKSYALQGLILSRRLLRA